MDTLVAALIMWIAAHSSLGAAPAPYIQFVPKHEMSNVYLGTADSKMFFEVEAFYLPVTATIYLPKSWRGHKLRDRSVLVHELAHHLQFANHVKTSCIGSLERQAYDLQFKWLRENSIEDPYGFTGLDVLTVIFAGTCSE